MMTAKAAALSLAVFVLAPGICQASAGVGFGESLRVIASAREAGTGGLPLEDLQARAIYLEASQIYLGMGIRWLGLALEGNILPRTRIGMAGTGLFAEGVVETTEAADGSFLEKLGTTQAAEYCWMAYAEQRWENLETGNLVTVRVTGHAVTQDLVGGAGSGFALSAAGFGHFPLRLGLNLLCWADGGPFGVGEDRGFARSMRAGAGLEAPGGLGLIGGKEGARFGLEGEQLAEGLWQAGVGGLYWLGAKDCEGPGFRLILRAGARGIQEGIENAQIRFGVGLMMGSEGNYGWAIDYSAVPFGEFGNLHYISARVLLGSMFIGRRQDFPEELAR